MKPNTKHATFKLCGQLLTLLAFIAISYLAIKPSMIPLVDQANDKFKHMLAFATLAGGLSLFWGFAWWRVALGLLLYGIGIEVVQWFVSGRYASVWDVMADAVGITVGLLVACGVKGGLKWMTSKPAKL